MTKKLEEKKSETNSLTNVTTQPVSEMNCLVMLLMSTKGEGKETLEVLQGLNLRSIITNSGDLIDIINLTSKTNNSLALLKHVLSSLPKPLVTEAMGSSKAPCWIYEAIVQGSLNTIGILMQYGVSPDLPLDEENATVMHYGSVFKKKGVNNGMKKFGQDLLSLALKYNGNKNAVTTKGYTLEEYGNNKFLCGSLSIGTRAPAKPFSDPEVLYFAARLSKNVNIIKRAIEAQKKSFSSHYLSKLDMLLDLYIRLDLHKQERFENVELVRLVIDGLPYIQKLTECNSGYKKPLYYKFLKDVSVLLHYAIERDSHIITDIVDWYDSVVISDTDAASCLCVLAFDLALYYSCDNPEKALGILGKLPGSLKYIPGYTKEYTNVIYNIIPGLLRIGNIESAIEQAENLKDKWLIKLLKVYEFVLGQRGLHDEEALSIASSLDSLEPSEPSKITTKIYGFIKGSTLSLIQGSINPSFTSSVYNLVSKHFETYDYNSSLKQWKLRDLEYSFGLLIKRKLYDDILKFSKDHPGYYKLYASQNDILSQYQLFLAHHATGKQKESELFLEKLNKYFKGRDLTLRANEMTLTKMIEQNDGTQWSEIEAFLRKYDVPNKEAYKALIERKSEDFVRSKSTPVSYIITKHADIEEDTEAFSKVKIKTKGFSTMPELLEYVGKNGMKNLSFLSIPEINKLAQLRKQQLLELGTTRDVSDVTTDTDESSWVVNNIIYTASDKNMIPLENGYHKTPTYAFIPESIIRDSSTLEKFKSAASKGFTVGEDKPGVKRMKKNGTEVLIKIKIPNFDIRLYTFEKFINSKGEILFIFDKSGNHAKLAQEYNDSTGLIPTICNSKEYKENKGDKSIKMTTAEQYESMNEYYNNFKPLDELISLKPLNRLSVQSTSKQVKVSFNHGTLWDPMMMEILDNPIKLNLDSNKTLYSLISIQTESPYNVTVSGAIQQLLEISHDD